MSTSASCPYEKCIHELVEARVSICPNALAIVQEQHSLTYRQLNGKANQLAHYLRKQGITAEERVGICLNSSPEMMVALLAVLKAGGACVPLDPNYPEERLQHMLQDSQVAVLIGNDGTLPRLAGTKAKLIDVGADAVAIAQEDSSQLANTARRESLAYVIYTSGSTGKPRGVLLTHAGLVNHNLVAVDLYGLVPSDRVLQFSSISFDIAIEEIFPTWMAGGCLVLKGSEMPITARGFLAWVEARGITVLDLPTAYWHELVYQLSEAKHRIPEKLRIVIVGGEKASVTALASWQKLVGNRIRWINTYGPTEASVIATSFEPHSAVEGVLPIGRPIRNVQVHVLDSKLKPVLAGARGELFIGGLGVARGYLNRPELTAEKFILDPFSERPGARLYRTGDWARYLPSGDLEYLGRVDYQVKVRGFRVEPGEIEAVLSQYPGIADVVVLPREGELGSNSLIAYFRPARSVTVTGDELHRFLKRKLPEFMLPSYFVRLETMPLNANGKVDRRSLPPPSACDMIGGGEVVKARDELERQLVNIWESLFNERPMGVRQNFFELGGHSLLAVRLMHRIERRLGEKLPITALLEAPTIEKLATVLRQQSRSRTWSCLIALQPKGSKPPLFCMHGAGGTVMIYRDLASQLSPDQPVYGLQASGLDGIQSCSTRVEDMAARYLDEIRTVQPQGPYFLAGLSFGGTVAFEMAQQLHKKGEAVGFVALFDTFPGAYETNSALVLKLVQMPWRQQLQYVQRKGRHYAATIGKRVYRLFLPAALKKVRRGIDLAGRHYSPKVYPGAVVVFRAREKSLRGAHDRFAGWKELVSGSLEICEIPGGHVSILAKPQVIQLARELQLRLDQAHNSSSDEQLLASVSAARATVN